MAYQNLLTPRFDATNRFVADLSPGSIAGLRMKQFGTGPVLSNDQPFAMDDPSSLPLPATFQWGGDSNSVGVGATDPVTQSVPALFKQRLDPAKWDVAAIAHSGGTWQQGGRTTVDWYRDMHVGPYQSYNPTPKLGPNPSRVVHDYVPGHFNVLPLMLGTNDDGKDSPSTPYMNGGTVAGVTYLTFEASLTRIVGELRAIGWKVLLIAPMNTGSAKSARIHHFIMRRGVAIGAADTLDVWSDPLIGQNANNSNTAYYTDSIHLNTLGLSRLYDLAAPKVHAIAGF